MGFSSSPGAIAMDCSIFWTVGIFVVIVISKETVSNSF